jgi:Arc/MetJ-type ribon-helix-helix transcriptional regulator
MNVTLSRQLRRFVEERVSDGSSKNASGVVSEALRGMIERDRVRQRIASGLSPWPPGPAGTGTAGFGTGSDIETLAFSVLMHAAKEEEKDLELILAEIKAATAVKQALRATINKVGRDVAANAGQKDGKPCLNLETGMNNPDAYTYYPMPFPDPQVSTGVGYYTTDLVPGGAPLADVAQLKAILDRLKGDLDSINEMSELTSMRLQMAVDRRSRLILVLANIMKKMSATQEALAQNLK